MIAIISDIHGNYEALKTVLKKIKELNCHKIISLGDVVGYYNQPHLCIDLLMENNVTNILGNHDYYLLKNIECPRSKYVSDILKQHRKILSKNQLKWLASSKKHLKIDECLFIHGGIEDYTEQYLYKVSQKDIPQECKILFSGHTHVQTLLKFDDKKYCNPGSVGQPRDGNPRAGFAILDNTEITLHRVEYDISKTILSMQEDGYPKKFYENLLLGTQIGGRVDRTIQI